MQSLIFPPNAIWFPVSAGDEDLLAATGQWAEALAAGQYDKAYEMTAHDPYYRWTPALIRQVIEGYGLPEPHPRGPFQVTSPDHATGEPREYIVERYDEPSAAGAIGEVRFDLPLNGEWSDLTATLAIYPVQGRLVLCLNEIHVF